ncbi:MFS transporter [Nakamurella sp. YIM 132084]|uniref:MFS transporter n=2 Tax=Nakamurella leprariae TaxID=2803911 RepID=A0A938Y4N7_9ACTN|nr:MFS transporter [Nakamurella leprariae]
MAATPAPPAPPQRFSRALALLVAGCLFMELLDATIVTPAIPVIAGDLGVAAVDLNVLITAYSLSVAVLIPLSGYLADRLGARRVFLTAVVVFVLASVGCALAGDLATLTAARVLQGVGGAMMVPVGRLVVLRSTSKTDLVRAIAFLTWPALVAPVVAPAVGGLLAQSVGWEWIFLINVPLGMIALAVGWRVIPGLPAVRGLRLDWLGFVLLAAGVAALVLGLETLGAGSLDNPAAWASLAGAAVLLGAAVRHLRRAAEPLLRLRILRIATFRFTAAGGTVYRAVVQAIPFLLPLLFQLAFGWSPAQAGLMVIAVFVGNIGIKPVTTPLMRRFGIRTVVVGACIGGAVCLVAMAFLPRDTPLWVIALLLVCSGAFRSIGFSGYNTAAFADVAPDELRSANTLNATLQELGTGLGIAIGALALRLGDTIAGSPSSTVAFATAFGVMAVLLVVPTVEALRLPASAARHVTDVR